MKDELFTDRQLADALAQVQAKHMDELPCSPEPHDFSDEFVTWMQALFREEQCRARRRRTVRYAAAALLAVVIGITLFFSVNTEARAAALAWIRREYSGHTDYLFQEGPDQNLPEYTLTWVPEGLQCVSDNTILERTLIYSDPKFPENSFVLAYARTRDVNGLVLDSAEHFTRIPTQINGNTADLYQSNDPLLCHLLIWIDEEAGVYFSIASTMDVATVLRIAEGIVPAE